MTLSSMHTVIPIGAYCVAIDKNNEVTLNNLNDPSTTTTVVVEFIKCKHYTLTKAYYIAIYHEAKDIWEVINQQLQTYTFVKPNSELYEICNLTLQKFNNKLLQGPKTTDWDEYEKSRLNIKSIKTEPLKSSINKYKG